MDDQRQTKKFSPAVESRIKAFTTELISERIARGEVDLKTMSFADMEMLSHEIGQRVAQQLGANFSQQQGELYSDDYNCPTCGIECEAIRHERTMQTIDGPTEVVELKSYCPRCRRHFFPCTSRERS
jgi:uncharacterized protein with PIN domain